MNAPWLERLVDDAAGLAVVRARFAGTPGKDAELLASLVTEEDLAEFGGDRRVARAYFAARLEGRTPRPRWLS